MAVDNQIQQPILEVNQINIGDYVKDNPDGSGLIKFILMLISLDYARAQDSSLNDEKVSFPAENLGWLDHKLVDPILAELLQRQNRRCSICILNFDVGDQYTVARCNSSKPHIFHTHCLRTWLSHNDTCPECRQKVVINRPPNW